MICSPNLGHVGIEVPSEGRRGKDKRAFVAQRVITIKIMAYPRKLCEKTLMLTDGAFRLHFQLDRD